MSATTSAVSRRIEVPVLIVGAGGSGLTSSILLSDLGVRSLLVEKHASTSMQPRAHLLNARTMEVFGQHGVAEEIYRRGAPPQNCGAMVWMTSIGGDGPLDRRVLHRESAYGGGTLESAYAAASAYRHGNLAQRWLEPLLVDQIRERPLGTVWFDHELVDLVPGADGVRAVVVARDGGERTEITARYVVAADGGKTVGPMLGIPMTGSPPLMDWINLHVRADFSELIPHDDAVLNRVTRLAADGQLEHCGVVPMGPTRWGRHSEEWTIMFCVPPGRNVDYADADAIAQVRRVLGLDDGHDMDTLSVSRWPVEGRVAERFREGRVFLVGDAAHRHPPAGALGLNTGVQDAHNLAWKLAATLDGTAGPSLLDSYPAERRPVACDVVDRALFGLFNQVALTAGLGVTPGAPAEWNRAQLTALLSDGRSGELRRAVLAEYFATNRIATAHLAAEMGYVYADCGVTIPDGTPPPAADPLGLHYEQIARPGARMPHAWLERDGLRVSTHHLVTPGTFLLLATDDRWAAAARRVAPAVRTVVVGRDATDPDGTWARLCGHAAGGAVLTRPDGFVAARALGPVADRDAFLRAALRAALGHGSPAGADVAA